MNSNSFVSKETQETKDTKETQTKDQLINDILTKGLDDIWNTLSMIQPNINHMGKMTTSYLFSQDIELLKSLTHNLDWKKKEILVNEIMLRFNQNQEQTIHIMSMFDYEVPPPRFKFNIEEISISWLFRQTYETILQIKEKLDSNL